MTAWHARKVHSRSYIAGLQEHGLPRCSMSDRASAARSVVDKTNAGQTRRISLDHDAGPIPPVRKIAVAAISPLWKSRVGVCTL